MRFVGTVLEAGEDVARVAPGDRVLGCYHSACGTCSSASAARTTSAIECGVRSRALLGSLPGTQADQALVPMANLTLRRVPDSVSDDVALFAGDVMGTGYHAIFESGVKPGDSVAVLGLGPVGPCAVQVAIAAGAGPVLAIDRVPQRLEVARGFGATPVHLTDESPRDVMRAVTEGRGADAVIDAVGHPDALGLSLRLAREAGTVVAIRGLRRALRSPHEARLD